MSSFARSWLALLLLGISACATYQSRHHGPPSTVDENEIVELTGNEAEAYNKIKSAYKDRKLNDTLQLSNAFLKSYPRSVKAGRAYNYIGLVYLSARRYNEAVAAFSRALALAGDDEVLINYALYNSAAALLELNFPQKASDSLDGVTVSNLDLATRLKFHYLRAQVFFRLKKPTESAGEILSASEILSEPGAEKAVANYRAQLLQSLAAVTEPAQLAELASRHDDSRFGDLVLFEAATRARSTGQASAAEKFYRQIVADHAGSEHFEEASLALRVLGDQNEVDLNSVGVLLPVTGRFEKIGHNTLEAVALGFRLFGTQISNSHINLVIEDSGETPEEALRALDKLYFEHHVVAVIGPLLSKGIDVVARRAQELGLPLISLTQKRAEPLDFVFYNSVTAKDQCQQLARYAVKDKGLKHFAILYPQDDFGREYSDHFWTAVEEMGGSIVGVESYPPRSTDFRTVVDKLSGLFYSDARSRELAELEKVRKELDITKQTRKTVQYFKLPPVVDYDAVFIPDEAKALGMAVPTFAYRDVDSITFLGPSTWGSKALLDYAGDYITDAYFVDTFFLNSANRKTATFTSEFRSVMGHDPTSIEALAYDAAKLVDGAMLAQKTEANRGGVRDYLARIADFNGVTGKISFDNGDLKRPLRLLNIHNKRVGEVTVSSAGG